MMPFFVLRSIRAWKRAFLLMCTLNQSLDYSNLVLVRVLVDTTQLREYLAKSFVRHILV